MDFLYNNNLINEIVDKLFRHRRNDYSEFHLDSTLAQTTLSHQQLRVHNLNYERLQVSLFSSSSSDTCIVFTHGYGSNRLECCNILRALRPPLALCAIDFSGSGKSEGDLVTYGMKEKEDIHCTLGHLRKLGYRKFILWGRSMGATSSLLYSLKYRPTDVVLQIIDSPFYSFEMIAFEIANKNVKAPEFVISFALQMAKKNCMKFEYNPFDIKLDNVGQCNIPALFVYSEEDSVINCQNTHKICERYTATFQKLVIEENHNAVRSPATIAKIFSFIHKYSKKLPLSPQTPVDKREPSAETKSQKAKFKPFSLSDSYVQQENEREMQKMRTSRKGIERVVNQQAENSRKFDDYGIWVASKNHPNLICSPSSKDYMLTKVSPKHRQTPTNKRFHLSLSGSVANKNKSEELSFSPAIFEAFKRQNSTITNYGYERTECNRDEKKRKINTVKSLQGSRHLNNSKYL